MAINQSDRPYHVSKNTLLLQGYPIIILVIIAVMSYGIFYAPILYNDDWSYMIGRWYGGTMKWFDLAELRPMQKIPFVILYGIFGLNIHVFYAIFWSLNVLAAVQLYFLMLKLTPKNVTIAFAMAAIFLVYPADFTHMWVSQLHSRVAVVFTLLYAHLLLAYKDNGRQSALWGSLLCLLFSFAMYEGQLGVAMAWCLLLIVTTKRDFWRNRSNLNLLLPLVLGTIFILWRTVGYDIIGIKDSYEYIDRVQLTPAVIISRLIQGYQVMVWAWIEPLTHAFGLSGGLALIFISGVIILCGLLAYWVNQRYRNQQNRYLTQPQHLDQLRYFMLSFLLGALFIVAGYIPLIAVFNPTFFQAGSRVNLFALLGASTTIISLFAIVVLLLSRKQPQINQTILAGTMPLILLGMMVQARIQYDDRAAWHEQKQIWQELFALAPDLEDGTSIHFIFSASEDSVLSLNRNGQRPPLFASWDTGAALNVLYGKNSLRGDVSTKGLFLEEGIKNQYFDEITPYDQALVMTYDGNPKQLRIIEDLEAEKLVDFTVSNYTPYEHIIETPTSQTDFRWLVGVTPDE